METHQILALIQSARAGEISALTSALARGEPMDERCPYTGTTPLLAACEAGQLKCVEYLLTQGANPDLQHFDGYNCYDSAGSDAVREALLTGGFALVVQTESVTLGLRGLRLLSAKTPQSSVWRPEVSGRSLWVEAQLHKRPTMQGQVNIRFEPRGGLPGTVDLSAADHIRIETQTAPTVTLRGVCGDLRVRVFDLDTIQKSDHPEFFLPDWGEPAGR